MTNKSQPTSINPSGTEETIQVILSKEKTPRAFELKVLELINICGMSREEAENNVSTTPFEIELMYSYNLGLWGIESEPLDSIEPFCPFSGVQIENSDY